MFSSTPAASVRAAHQVRKIGRGEGPCAGAADSVAKSASIFARGPGLVPARASTGAAAGASCSCRQRSKSAGALRDDVEKTCAHAGIRSIPCTGRGSMPGWFACSQLRLVWPGIASVLPDSFGTQKLWMTSPPCSRTRTGTPTGMWISLAVANSPLGCAEAYFTSHHHCRPVTSIVSAGFARRPGDCGQRDQGPYERRGQRNRRDHESDDDPVMSIGAPCDRNRLHIQRIVIVPRPPQPAQEHRTDHQAHDDRNDQSEPRQRQYRVRRFSGAFEIRKRRASHAARVLPIDSHSRLIERMAVRKKEQRFRAPTSPRPRVAGPAVG